MLRTLGIVVSSNNGDSLRGRGMRFLGKIPVTHGAQVGRPSWLHAIQ